MRQFVIYDCPETDNTNELYGPFESDDDVNLWIQWMQQVKKCSGLFTITSASNPYQESRSPDAKWPHSWRQTSLVQWKEEIAVEGAKHDNS